MGAASVYTNLLSRLAFPPVLAFLPLAHLKFPMRRMLLTCWLAFGTALVLGHAAPAVAVAGWPEEVSFELDVQPIFTARGCNAGACHGKARGQNGFQLSLLGFDPDFDHAALTAQARGRRLFPAAPERSLLLLKATGEVAHGGGVRIDRDGDDYRVLRRWIAAGAARRVAEEPQLVRVEVSPTERFLTAGERQPLKVTAYYSDGSARDVTDRTQFQSSEAVVAGVSASGEITAGPIPGEATVMARYMYQLATCHIAIPLPGKVEEDVYAALPRRNFIDDLAWRKLASLGIVPSAAADDAKFLRRIHLDLIGRVPTPDETRAFLADDSSDKRLRAIDALLERPEYADHWATKWADLLRPNPYRVGIKAVFNYDDWIRDSFRQNKPYDRFVTELLTAQGSTWDNGATVLFRDRREPDEITTMVSQLFLGVRLECAKCHHHPFEKWGQDDFYSFAAYFARLGRKGTGLSPPISGGEEILRVVAKGEVKHPLTQEPLPPRPLFGDAPAVTPEEDPRAALAAWMTSEQNPYFAQVITNRVWADLMGRGLVEPVDDLRATNPATNEPLLAALAEDFVAHRYDLKHLLRTICASHLYGLSSTPNERNVGDRQNYSRHYRQRLRAEVLADAVSDITGTVESFAATPPDSKANQIWTTRVRSVFLDTFGRPNENQDPPCERTPEATVTQTLHLMNSPQLHQRVTANAGRPAQWAAAELTPEQIVEEIYLWVYARLPDEEERAIGAGLFAEPETSRRQAAEDLMWALLNTPEFFFKD
jgi:hypothetical protein